MITCPPAGTGRVGDTPEARHCRLGERARRSKRIDRSRSVFSHKPRFLAG
ncbi:hypothetical protein HMPREF9154_3093 [Arachnia propionica F0230a]|nr:hypothetical protein HMPREF9154_3093 [Arachnia propionica F0230a]